MTQATNNAQQGGIGFFGLLTILFIGLKLGNVIDWSWWWVLAPLWVPTAIALAVFIVVGVVYLGLSLLGDSLRKRRNRVTRKNIDLLDRRRRTDTNVW